MSQKEFSCVDCGAINCNKRDSVYPEFCPTAELTEEERQAVLELYGEPENHRMAVTAAAVEADFYLKYTRVEETVEFARRMGYRKIGIATCVGLLEESRVFARILRKNGFEVCGVVCKAGSVDKTEIGIPEEAYLGKGPGPVMCNPILQAKLLNKEGTDFNVVIGLCVGHDSLFYKYSEAPVTTLIAKDRVLGHNPAAALYQCGSYYSRLLKDGGKEKE
ncbi:MAG: DUF1847 domain-containing protein [Firmicutes bacterium]|nr:DUF1847 domain-containing protein [Bacillota bacterium]